MKSGLVCLLRTFCFPDFSFFIHEVLVSHRDGGCGLVVGVDNDIQICGSLLKENPIIVSRIFYFISAVYF